MSVHNASNEFYTGIIAHAYAPLRGTVAPSEPYERFVRRYGEPALEIGCGHGEPMLDLVAAGLDVVGLDSSADMLSLCKAEAERRGLNVTLVCQRMEAMDIDRVFRVMYFAGPTFQLVIERADALRTLQRIANHLAPEGRVLVPLFTPLPIEPSEIGVWREHVFPNGEMVAVSTVAQSYREDEQRVDTTLQYRRGTRERPIDVIDRVWSLCWYADTAFEQLVDAAGLAIERVNDHGASGRSFVLKP
jgi:SAM-dependent methyltransferase